MFALLTLAINGTVAQPFRNVTGAAVSVRTLCVVLMHMCEVNTWGGIDECRPLTQAASSAHPNYAPDLRGMGGQKDGKLLLKTCGPGGADMVW
jgi:hypothetical protein